MNRKLFLAIVLLGCFACRALTPNPEPDSTPSAPQPAPTTASQPQPESSPMATPGFTIVRLRPDDGDLETLLAEEAAKAAALGQIPVVEFDATWCPPCQAIDAAIADQNKLMLDAYAGAYIIKLDVDEWGWSVGSFKFDAIPVYFKLDEKGSPTGERIDGGAWNEDIPENIAPVMDAFFHEG